MMTPLAVVFVIVKVPPVKTAELDGALTRAAVTGAAGRAVKPRLAGSSVTPTVCAPPAVTCPGLAAKVTTPGGGVSITPSAAVTVTLGGGAVTVRTAGGGVRTACSSVSVLGTGEGAVRSMIAGWVVTWVDMLVVTVGSKLSMAMVAGGTSLAVVAAFAVCAVAELRVLVAAGSIWAPPKKRKESR